MGNNLKKNFPPEKIQMKEPISISKSARSQLVIRKIKNKSPIGYYTLPDRQKLKSQTRQNVNKNVDHGKLSDTTSRSINLGQLILKMACYII